MIIVAFDLGSREAGCVAINTEEMKNIPYLASTWKATKADPIERLYNLWGWLNESVEWGGEVVIAFDSPYHKYARAVRQLERIVGLLFGASFWNPNCHKVIEVKASEVKLALAGNGNASKEEMVAAAEAQFPMSLGQKWGKHEADALGVALAAAGKLKAEAMADAEEGGDAIKV